MNGAEALNEIDRAIRDGAAHALRARAGKQRQKAADGTFVIARSIEDVWKAFEIWGIETRETAQ
jgi:hypothetical protein